MLFMLAGIKERLIDFLNSLINNHQNRIDMKRVVQLLIELPDVEATEWQIEEFIEFETGFGCRLSADNPFNGLSYEVEECYVEDRDVIN
jgi:hypothetical protein|nr:MAG TPA: hypothetical protein [Caudoviricetes sp.]